MMFYILGYDYNSSDLTSFAVTAGIVDVDVDGIDVDCDVVVSVILMTI